MNSGDDPNGIAGYDVHLIGAGDAFYWSGGKYYQGHDNCGQCYTLTDVESGKSATAVIGDWCPSHESKDGEANCVWNQLDLSPTLYAKLGGKNSKVTWKPVVCPWGDSASLRVVKMDGSSQYQSYLNIAMGKTAITSATLGGVEGKNDHGRWVFKHNDDGSRASEPLLTVKFVDGTSKSQRISGI
jgi:hypothetical protein